MTQSQPDSQQEIARWTEALAKNPEDTEAYMRRGIAYLRSYFIHKALPDLDRALELNPNLALAYIHRGRAHRRLNRLDQAIANYNRALELEPENAYAWALRAGVYLDTRRYKEAVRDFQEALRLQPDSAEAHYDLACALASKADLDEALTYLSKAIAKDQEYSWYAPLDPDLKNLHQHPLFQAMTTR